MSSCITIDPNILGGTAVFSGTRVPVDSLFDSLKRGRSIDYFLEQFPTVRREQVEKLLDEVKANGLSLDKALLEFQAYQRELADARHKIREAINCSNRSESRPLDDRRLQEVLDRCDALNDLPLMQIVHLEE